MKDKIVIKKTIIKLQVKIIKIKKQIKNPLNQNKYRSDYEVKYIIKILFDY